MLFFATGHAQADHFAAAGGTPRGAGEEENPEEEKPEEEKLVTRTYKSRNVKLDPAELQAFIASTNNYIEDAKKFQEFYAEQELLASQHYQDARYKALAQLATDTTNKGTTGSANCKKSSRSPPKAGHQPAAAAAAVGPFLQAH